MFFLLNKYIKMGFFFLLIVNPRKAILKVYIFSKMLFFTVLDEYHDSSDLCNRPTLQLCTEPEARFMPNL